MKLTTDHSQMQQALLHVPGQAGEHARHNPDPGATLQSTAAPRVQGHRSVRAEGPEAEATLIGGEL